ncbi:MAG: hypothetical protein NT102_06150 [Caldiserica bacterium]|nr:hypothetical protein [Caldisericota bacterium]
MRKRARSVLTGLLVLCCAFTGFVPVACVQADSSGLAGRDIIVTENAGLTRMAYPVAVALTVVSAGTGETTQTSTPVASPSSGPLQTAWAWIQKTTRSEGAFVASLSMSIRDFFVSGKALKVLQTATQAINNLAVRLFLPLSALVVPILERMVSGLSVTPELVAAWMFWVVIVLALIILIFVLRPRRNVAKRLPKVSPRTAGQGENTVEFGLVEQGPKPSPATSLDQLARTHEKQETPPVQEPEAQLAIAEESSHARLDTPSVPEISLEPLGFFAGSEAVPTAEPDVLADTAAVIAPPMPPLLEFTPSEAEPPTTQTKLSELMTAPAELSPTVPADVPSEALLTPPQEGSSAEELLTETLHEPFPEPELRPIGQEAPVQPVEPESNASDTVLPLDRPLPAEESSVAEEALQADEILVPEAPVTPQAGSIEEPVSTQEMSTPVPEEVLVANETVPAVQETSEVAATPEAVPVEAVPVEEVPVEEVRVEAVPVETVPVEAVPVEPDHESPAAKLPETNLPTPSSADLLSRLLDDEESFQQTMVAAGAAAGVAAPVPPFAPVPARRLAPQPSIFSGDVELDTLLHDGVVADAGALAQLFRGGYRNRISKLAVSAKDLQNVPEEMRHVIKLTIVALSPIELSIARDLAMRLEAPGFVGEALLVAKKMGYENYLTTYKKISKNYKDVSIVETVSLKVPEMSLESGEDLISFS